jgi:hypothetical protein
MISDIVRSSQPRIMGGAAHQGSAVARAGLRKVGRQDKMDDTPTPCRACQPRGTEDRKTA